MICRARAKTASHPRRSLPSSGTGCGPNACAGPARSLGNAAAWDWAQPVRRAPACGASASRRLWQHQTARTRTCRAPRRTGRRTRIPLGAGRKSRIWQTPRMVFLTLRVDHAQGINYLIPKRAREKPELVRADRQAYPPASASCHGRMTHGRPSREPVSEGSPGGGSRAPVWRVCPPNSRRRTGIPARGPGSGA